MSTLEAALRGGAVAILLLTFGLHARDLLTSRLRRYSTLFQLCAVAFIVESAPGFDTLDLRQAKTLLDELEEEIADHHVSATGTS